MASTRSNRNSPASAPTRSELQRLLRTIATRFTRALEGRGLLIRDEENPALDLEPADGFEQLLGAAVYYRIATGPHAGRKALTLHTVSSKPPADNSCIPQLSGFSLHAGTRCRAHERDSLERLCRYIARPALSNERLSVNDRGQIEGFYVVVPPQHASWGAPPPSWYIDALMRREGRPYYVGLLKAAEAWSHRSFASGWMPRMAAACRFG